MRVKEVGQSVKTCLISCCGSARGKQIKRAFGRVCHSAHDMSIDHGRLNIFMPQQMLPKQFCRIRCYGILGGRGRKQNLATCKKLLNCSETVEKIVAETEAVPEYNTCPVCGGEMIRHGIIAGSCLPKPIMFRTEQQTLAA